MNKELLFEHDPNHKAESLRVFLSANPEAELVSQLTGIVARLRRELELGLDQDTSIRWTRSNQFHVTLLFLGSLQLSLVNDLKRRLSTLTRLRLAPPQILLHGFGCFPAFNRPRVIWIGVTTDRAFRTLQRVMLREIGEPFGIAFRDMSYPHLTIARLPTTRPLPTEPIQKLQEILGTVDFPALPWKLGSICLMRSVPASHGPDYNCLAEYPLGDE
ncbi:MAG: RNA 2',3'-cyclic phosphodiesterase [Verrucomicrobia bacterium]|nr:RNA 2',3'-cyclic phosphodiesterase [Verrucomicrobiota bacterium]